jgi:hypothetical protein
VTDQLTIIEAMEDSALFARFFRSASWNAWKAFLAVLFALPRTEEMDTICRAATGRTMMPDKPFTQAWCCVGRRGGKSEIAALVAVYFAFFREYAPYLAPGELATVMVVAADRKQARVVMRFVRGFIRAVPMLSSLVTRETRESVELANRVVIEVHTASFRSVRGYTLATCINDELCFWRTEESAADPDKEILAAQRPALTTVPGALMLNISSPYARVGTMHAAFEEHFGRDDSDILFWKAPSRALPEQEAAVEMNPAIDLRLVEAAYVEDSAAAAAEWGAEFRADVERLFTFEMLDRVTFHDRPFILPPCFDDPEETAWRAKHM